MRGFAAYQLHTALNLHFGKSGYDYFKYNGKTRVNEESFKKSNFKWQYMGIERDVDNLLWYFYLKFKDNHFSYTTPQMAFRKMKNISDPDSYMEDVIEPDLDRLSEEYGYEPHLMFSNTGLYPDIYQKYKKEIISLETILLIDICISEVFNKDLSNDIVAWPDIVDKSIQVRPFVEELFDIRRFTSQFSDRILEHK